MTDKYAERTATESELHNRIAAAVVAVIGDSLGSGTELGLDIADAVIAELGLSQECSWHVPVSKWAPHNPKHVRYVTDWKADHD